MATASSNASANVDPLATVATLTRLPDHGLGGRRKRRPERHDEILSAAVRLFHARGYHSTSVDDIADAVGVSPTAVYRHFRNKQEILDTAALWAGEQLSESLSGVDESLPAERRLERLVDDFVRMALKFPTFVDLVTREFHALSPEARVLSIQRRENFVAGYTATLREVVQGLSPEDAELHVHLVIALICSVTTYRDHDRKRVAASVKAAAMAALLNGHAGR